ncbi:alpha/beta fold hydrolase [Melittangium boletus]|uniref:Alpha/beta hydrolase fold-1 n=1 Tax=Melittangium boletus DSM 14713 TaxID=1294270 RepID=A0A250ISR9_9BACT|nr:alpha/beta hydrolase [Melittangium boletus]ATB34227.1 Alpha/beta hydrolase fold-1 precursor [Melittangium boletus DSM 14713]
MSHFTRQDFLTVPDGAPLYYQVRGTGEPGVVLCDGLGCDGFVWKYLEPQLERDHRVLRWNYRGHGRSGLPTRRQRIGMSYSCDDLNRLMDAAGLQQAVVFGHSMGVQVALEFHRRYPERVKGLVLVCGSYGTLLNTFHDGTLLKRLFPLIRFTVESFPEPVARLTRSLLSTPLAMEVALSVELNRSLLAKSDLIPYFTHLANMDPVVFVRTLRSAAHHNAWRHLPDVDVPTLVIAGQHDKFTPAWISRRMAAHIPGAQLLMLPEGTHVAPLEYRDTIERRVERFFREHGLTPTPRPSAPHAAHP